jgi:hypothetical protein
MKLVESSNIVALQHDPINLTMIVAFKNGTFYLYQGVPHDLFDQILKADSVGSAFNKMVKSDPARYPYRKIEASLSVIG